MEVLKCFQVLCKNYNNYFCAGDSKELINVVLTGESD